jgi:hypothetical protein
VAVLTGPAGLDGRVLAEYGAVLRRNRGRVALTTGPMAAGGWS